MNPENRMVTDMKKCQQEVVDWSKNRFGVAGCLKNAGFGCFYNSIRGVLTFNICSYSNMTDPEYVPICERSISGKSEVQSSRLIHSSFTLDT